MLVTSWQREADSAADSMNREHQFQLALIDQLTAALEAKAPGVEALFTQLATASDLHFVAEETLMRQHAYAKYHLHVEEHRRLIDLVHALQERHGAGAPVLEAVTALRRSLAAHINGLDEEFEALVRAGQAPD